MRVRTVVFPVITWLALLSFCAPTFAQQQPPAATPAAPAAAVDPKADAALKRMGALLTGAKAFTFKSHSTVDQSLDNGQAVQVARNQHVMVRRPDHLAAVVEADLEDLNYWYDGKRVTVLNRRVNAYSTIDAPPTIDATFDMLAEKYGLVVPLSDLLFDDPYKALVNGARSGVYIGTGYVFDTKCDHLAFRQAGVDWQIWIEQGEKPVPRKVVITYKELPARPQYTSYLSDWNLNPELKDEQFAAKIPQGAKKVEFGAAPAPAAPTGAKP
jgi:hypothetical protein